MKIKSVSALLIITLAAASTALSADEKANVDKEIDKVLKGRTKLVDVYLNVHWAGARGQFMGRSAVVYGKGVGIWNRNTQFSLTKDDVRALLKTLQEHKFSQLKRNYGGLARPGGGPAIGAPEFLKGSITLRIGSVTHGSSQLGGGEQSAELAKLADALLTISEKAAKKNPVSATSLDEGIDKVAKGELLPETISVLVHRLILKGGKENEEGFLLRIQGRTVTTRRRPKTGLPPEVRMELTNKQFQEIVKLLADNDPGAFPVNLWAKHYTDFNVTVLNHRKSMQARQFARLKPTTHGEKQKQFDRIFTAMEKLHQKVLKEGKEVKQPKR